MIVDRVGRRRSSLLIIPGAALALVVLGACFMLDMNHGRQAWMLIGCLLVYMGTMWVYGGMNLLAFLFIWFLVPETAGHSLEKIEGALHEDRFRPARGKHPDREFVPSE